MLLALLVLGVRASAPAFANKPSVTEYSLSIVEGESTHPKHSILSTQGWTNSRTRVVISIIHAGLVVATESGSEGAWMQQVPEVGDDVTLEVGGTLVASVIYDGLPTTEVTVCAGSENFSGQRSAGEEVEGADYSFKSFPTDEPLPAEQAQVTVLAGANFAGNFLKPLAIGETVRVKESYKTTLASGAVFEYSSENQRPVAACPVPPAPPSPPVVVLPALQGSILKIKHASIRSLLRSDWLSEVDINQAGTVTEDLYAQGGTLPAHASSVSKAHKHHKPAPALLLARGVASASAPGTVGVVLHLTSRGRSVLRHDRRIKAVLITTLRNANGTLTLARRSLTLSL